jgi:hypothetical protein
MVTFEKLPEFEQSFIKECSLAKHSEKKYDSAENKEIFRLCLALYTNSYGD